MKLQNTFVLVSLIISTVVNGQVEKDKRAELEIKGGFSEISVSPDEKLWLTTSTGNMYFTPIIDSNWHYSKSLFIDESKLSMGMPRLERISFFNENKAIMTGYICSNKGSADHDGLYYTEDGGKTWELINFGYDSWIYDIEVDKEGHAWMGGSKGEIYYSSDFGIHWVKLNSPFNSFSRMHTIFMSNEHRGIAGALHNTIYITDDNWQTSSKISSPLDQEMMVGASPYDRIEKIIFWNDWIVVNQNGHIFYSKKDTIEWKKFPIKIIDFEIERGANELFAITSELGVISFTSPTEFQLVTNKKLNSSPRGLKIVNNSLFIVGLELEVYKINSGSFKHSYLYTSDHKIHEPRIIKHSSNMKWGISDKHLYLSKKDSSDWYRENRFDFYISDFKIMNDSSVILFDKKDNGYMYHLQTQIIDNYVTKNPIQNFLNSPIKSVTINAGSMGCFHYYYDEVHYVKSNDSTITTNKYTKGDLKRNNSNFKNQLPINKLMKALYEVDSSSNSIPSLKDFNITDIDKKKYLNLVDDRIKGKEEVDYFNNRKIINEEFYNAVPKMLDSINDSVIAIVLNQHENIRSTTSNWFRIELVNHEGDSIQVSKQYYEQRLPWHLPLTFEYNGLIFKSYNIEFARFVDECIPQEFFDKELFDNSRLIMEIADYLYSKED